MIIDNFGILDKKKAISALKLRYDSSDGVIDRGNACHYIGGYIAAISDLIDKADARCLHQEMQAYVLLVQSRKKSK